MSKIDPKIFRAYDIRGKANEQLTEEACKLIGQAFGSIVRKRYDVLQPSIAVGRDARTHGPNLEKSLVEGLKAAGCKVFLIGQTPSPLNYFTVCNENLDGSVQVTASHNPKEDNGLKLQVRDAEAFSGDDLQRLRESIEVNDVLEGQGTVETIEAITPYIESLSRIFLNAGEGFHIVVDAGNGVTGPVYCEVLRKVGCKITELYTEPDGNFPNHAADPSKHDTLQDLQKAVKKAKANLGFAFDGDGDRVGVVDEKGKIRTADEILLLLSQDHLKRYSKASIICTVSNSSVLLSEIEKWGGTAVMTKVGHSFVEHAMREHHALLGGEQSGHFFCGEEYYPFDDALAAALRILKIASSSKEKPFSALLKEFPKVYQAPEQRPYCSDEAKAGVIEKVTQHFSAQYPVNTLDGVRIDFGNFAWAGIRQSNTSPCISVCIEARSSKKLKDVEKVVWEHLHSYSELKIKN